MHARFSRRNLPHVALAVPASLLASSALVDVQAANGSKSSDAVLGSYREAFDAVYGGSRQESGFTVYDFRHNQQAAYWVRFDADSQAEYVEIDFTALPGGGLEFSRGALGESRFIPTDAYELGAAGALGNLQTSRSAFYINVHHSELLSYATGRSGYSVVVDEFRMDNEGRFEPSPLLRTFVSMESYEIHPVVATGENPSIEDYLDEWAARYGSISQTSRGFVVDNPPLQGHWILGTTSNDGDHVVQIDASFDTPISTREAALWVGSMVKDKGSLEFTYWLPPSPNGGTGLRIHVFNTYRYEYVISMQYVSGTEENGTVDRIMLVHTNQYMNEGF